METMINGILQVYGATGEGTSLQFVDELVLPKKGEFITDFSGVYTVLPGDIIQFITRWGEPTNIIVTEKVMNDLIRVIGLGGKEINIKYLPSKDNKSWGERAKV